MGHSFPCVREKPFVSTHQQDEWCTSFNTFGKTQGKQETDGRNQGLCVVEQEVDYVETTGTWADGQELSERFQDSTTDPSRLVALEVA